MLQQDAVSATRESILLDSHLPWWSDQDLDALADALLRSSDVLIDELFDDERLLTSSPPNGFCEIGRTLQLVDLPKLYWSSYSGYFARKLILTAGTLTAKFLDEWHGPETVAECFVLDLLLANTAQWIEVQEMDLPEEWRSGLEQALYIDLEHRALYERSSRVGLTRRFMFEYWFSAPEGSGLPPYVLMD